MIKLLLGFVLFAAALVASAQMDTSLKKPVTDEQKIADALRAGPAFVTKDAVIADWPSDPKDPNAQYRILRPGKSRWTCLPGVPGYPHDEPMCLDKTSMQWIKDSLAGRPVHIANLGDMNGTAGQAVLDPLHGSLVQAHRLVVRIAGDGRETCPAAFPRAPKE